MVKVQYINRRMCIKNVWDKQRVHKCKCSPWSIKRVFIYCRIHYSHIQSLYALGKLGRLLSFSKSCNICMYVLGVSFFRSSLKTNIVPENRPSQKKKSSSDHLLISRRVFATQTLTTSPRKGRLVAANLWAEPPAAKGHTIAVIPIIQPGFRGVCMRWIWNWRFYPCFGGLNPIYSHFNTILRDF